MSAKKQGRSLDPEEWENAEELESKERNRRKLFKEQKRTGKQRLDEENKSRKRGKDDPKN